MANIPRIEKIEAKYADNGIELTWAKTDLTSGSILIYRSDESKLGTYTIINSDDLTDNVYVDTIGSIDSWYKIQTFDGTGSSPFSESVSLQKLNFLCSDLDVRKILKLSANQDEIGSEEIEGAILDAQDEIYGDYGKPLKKTWTVVSTLGSKYTLQELKNPIQKVDSIYVSGSEINVGSYDTNLGEGAVILDSTFNSAESGEIIQFEWTPKVFNLLCKNMAARDLLEDFTIRDGENSESPKIRKIEDRINRYKNKIADANVPIMSSQYLDYDSRDGEYIYQEFENY